jgi:TetR/AcrR family transcriptional repressor of mexJK operon
MRSDTRRPGRPPGATTEQLLAVARAEFLRHGFERTTMDAIVRRAGVSKASLYQAFPSKDDLYRAVVTDWADQGVVAMRPHVAELLDADEIDTALRRLVRMLQAAVLSPEVIAMRSLVTRTADRHPDIGVLYASHSWARNIAELAGGLAELGRRGVLAVPDADMAAEQLTWLAVGSALNLQQLTAGSQGIPDERLATIADAAVTTFMRAHRA